jgi:hypothetical protein
MFVHIYYSSRSLLTQNLVFLQSSNADIDELPNVVRQMSLVQETPQKNVPSGSFFSVQAGSSRHAPSHFGTTQFQFPSVLHFVSKPPDFVEPRPSDIFLRGILDPDSPSAPPRINPWSDDYFIGDVAIVI